MPLPARSAENDFAFLLAAVKCNKNELSVDFNRFAEMQGYKTSKSACTLFGVFKKAHGLDKIGQVGGQTGKANGGAGKGSAAKNGRGKRKVSEDDSDDSGENDAGRKKVKTEEEDSESGEETKIKEEHNEEETVPEEEDD